MKYKFITQPLLSGLYEPEGIYLSTPFEVSCRIIQFWGQHPNHYAQYKYNGVPLKGHIGVDFGLEFGTPLFVVDDGRIVEISYEVQGFERYVKVEHRWGESFYAHVGMIEVESGQLVKRNQLLTYVSNNQLEIEPHLHFSIRITPFNRFDGWGGFTDPLPFLHPNNIILYEDNLEEDVETYQPHKMAEEKTGMRRP